MAPLPPATGRVSDPAAPGGPPPNRPPRPGLWRWAASPSWAPSPWRGAGGDVPEAAGGGRRGGPWARTVCRPHTEGACPEPADSAGEASQSGPGYAARGRSGVSPTGGNATSYLVGGASG